MSPAAGAVGSPALWHGLVPGEHAVGFRGGYELDRSRTFYPERDHRGQATGFSGARPVRIAIWFPARPRSGAMMHFGDYASYPATGPDAVAVEALVAAADRGSPQGGGIQGVVRGNPGGFATLMRQPMAARRDAAPAVGRYPLIIYSLGQNDYTQESLVLFEYLASHGFVVVTVPHLGTSPRRSILWIYEPTSFEAQLRDLEFALAHVSRLPFVDASRMAAVGHSMGGTYALLLAMRNPSIDALAGLDASFLVNRANFEFDITTSAYFDPSVVRMPVFQQHRGGDAAINDGIIDRLIYADRWLVRYDRLTHGDFQDAPFYAAMAAPNWGPVDELAVRPVGEAVAGHRLVVERLRIFLDWALRGRGDFVAQTRSFSDTRETPAAVRRLLGLNVPNAEGFYRIAETDGINRALELYTTLSGQNGGARLFAEPEVIRIINEQVWGGNPGRALDMARLYTTAYPNAINARSVLARAFERVGQRDNALGAYRRVLELNPNDEAARTKVEQLSAQR